MANILAVAFRRASDWPRDTARCNEPVLRYHRCMGAKIERYFVPAVIGFSPLALFLLNWDAEQMTRLMRIFRAYTITVLAAEIFTIVVALREGMVGFLREMRLPRPVLIAIAGLLAIAIGTAIFVAPASFLAGTRTAFWIIHLLFGLSVAFLCGRFFSSRDLVNSYLLAFAAFALAFAIFAVGAQQRSINWTWDLPSFAHIRHLGIYATPMIALSIGILATARRRAVWVATFFLAACGFALCLWTGSRGPVIAIAAAVVVGLFVAPAMRRPRAWGSVMLSLALAYCVVLWLPVPADNMGAVRTIAATTESGNMLTGRLALWAGVIDAIEQRPLFGFGDGQMMSVAPFGSMAQAHNVVLQVLLAWGFAGLLCTLVLSFYFVRMAVSALRADERRVLPLVLAMLSLLALSMVDAALYHILPVSIFAACAAMVASEWRCRNIEDARSKAHAMRASDGRARPWGSIFTP